MVASIRSSYKSLLNQIKDLEILQSIESLVHWDMETMMPPRAVEQRSQQLSLLSRINHKISTNPEIGKILKNIFTSPKQDILSEAEKRNVYLTKKNYDEQTALPEKLVGEIAKQQAITVNTWKAAKKAKNFSILKPELEKLVELNKKKAQILMQVKKTKIPYDALIDIYEPKMTSEKITIIFDQLLKGLSILLQRIQNVRQQPDTDILRIQIPVENQREIAKELSATLGYDTTSTTAGGRIDETEHPFTSGYYDDVRITTHYHLHNYFSSIFSVLHETGHALYQQNLNTSYRYQPIGSPSSLGIHESQSRLFENIIGRSREFWSYMFPKLKQITAPKLDQVNVNQFVHAINKVEPSKIRIEADEVTYNLHIIIRFQIEKDLFADKITVSELPEIWKNKYAKYLGINVENDSEGVMQDTHWSSGLYGYFPTYALGNIYSGQIVSVLEKDVPEWRSLVSQGNLKKINGWLTKNVYHYAALYDPAELIFKIVGNELQAEPYLNYLREKYGRLYGF